MGLKKPFRLKEFIKDSGINQQNAEFKLLFTNPSEFIARESNDPSGNKDELGIVNGYFTCLWEILKLTEHFETISNWAKKHNIQWKCWMKK